jgi:hypothetical protein
MTQKFDRLFESVVNNLLTEAPIAMDSPETTKETVNKIVNNIINAKGKGHWYNALNSKELKELKDNPEKVKEKATELVWNVVKIILPERDYTYNPDITRTKLKQGDVLKDAIKTVFGTGNKHSEFLSNRFSNDALLGLAKDVVEKAVKTSEDGSGIQLVPVTSIENMTQKDFNQALRKANDRPLTDGNGEDEADEEEIEADEETEKKVSYNPKADYYLKSYEEMPSGKLSGDVRVAYDRLSGMSGEVHSGADFVKQLAKSGLGARQFNQLLDLGIMEPADGEISDVGDTEGFKETEDEYIDRLTRSAREDFRSSDLNPKYGGIQFD